MTRLDSQHLTVPAPRGLTLLEVLAATMMLALLAATCSPIIAKAMALVRQGGAAALASPTVSLPELEEVADAFMADPKQFGVATAHLHEIEHVEFTCPSSPHAGAADASPLAGCIVRVARLGAPENAKHFWLVFACEESKVVRWVPLPDEAASKHREGGPT